MQLAPFFNLLLGCHSIRFGLEAGIDQCDGHASVPAIRRHAISNLVNHGVIWTARDSTLISQIGASGTLGALAALDMILLALRIAFRAVHGVWNFLQND
jgi:hypothetical protein